MGALYPGGFAIPTDFELDRTLYAIFAETRYQITQGIMINAGLAPGLALATIAIPQLILQIGAKATSFPVFLRLHTRL